MPLCIFYSWLAMVFVLYCLLKWGLLLQPKLGWELNLTSDSQQPFLMDLPRARIAGASHHTQLNVVILMRAKRKKKNCVLELEGLAQQQSSGLGFNMHSPGLGSIPNTEKKKEKKEKKRKKKKKRKTSKSYQGYRCWQPYLS